MNKEEAKAQKAALREQRKAEAAAKMEQIQRELDEKMARTNGADPDKHGRTVESQRFGGKTITIFSNGFVQVAGMISSPAPERLIQIEANIEVTKKTGIGRGVAAVATQGWSLLTPNKRGDIYLTILTDKQMHTLNSGTPTDAEIKAVHALELAGKAVLGGSGGGPAAASSQSAGEKSIPDQIRDMKALLDEGLVSQEDFDQFKKQLLG